MAAGIYMFQYLSLIRVEKKIWAKDYKKRQLKSANLIFDHRGSHFFQNGRQNIHVLISQFPIDLEKRSWCISCVSIYIFGTKDYTKED